MPGSSSSVPCPRRSPDQDEGSVAPCTAPPLSPSQTLSARQSTSLSQCSLQLSILQTFERKQKYAANHPQAQALNANIARLCCALEMLLFSLVETKSFNNLMAAAVPQYSVPSHHYFSRCAIPTLNQQVSNNITHSLTNAVAVKVHLMTNKCLWPVTVHFPDGTLGECSGGWVRFGPRDDTCAAHGKDCKAHVGPHFFRHLFPFFPILHLLVL